MQVRLTTKAKKKLELATQALAALGLTPEQVGLLAMASGLVDCANDYLEDSTLEFALQAYSEDADEKWNDLVAGCLVHVKGGRNA
jgi:hypothetical protein